MTTTGGPDDVLGYATYFGWSQATYFIYGMADQSGNFQAWNAACAGREEPHHRRKRRAHRHAGPALPARSHRGCAAGEPRGGTSVSTGPERDRRNVGPARPGHVAVVVVQAQPGRGLLERPEYYRRPEIRMEEMNLLKAEALFRQGDKAGAADIINETRVPAGLDATTQPGTTPAACPSSGRSTSEKDANGCGGLFEMLKWEKRMENTAKGPFGVLWFFDGRGWGDLWKNTWVHLSIPCAEAHVLQLLPCGTTGGPGGEFGSAGSVYKWNGEG